MKYKIIAFAVLLCLGVNNITAKISNDGENKEDGKFYTQTIFHPHWVIRAQAGFGETVGEASFSDLLSPAFAASIGYNFNKNVGIQVQFSGFKAKGGYPATKETYEWDYKQGTINAVLDLDNILWGFKADRIWNPYAFAGAGMCMTSNNDEAEKLAKKRLVSPYLWNKNSNRFVCQGGIGLDIRLSKRVAINLEANTSLWGDKANSKKGSNPDWQINALAGLSFTLGKSSTVQKILIEEEPSLVPENLNSLSSIDENSEKNIEEDNASNKDNADASENTENTSNEVSESDVKITETEPAKTVENIFYNRNQYKLKDSEKAKIERLISFMQKHPESTITITGFADKKTGNQHYNMRLSKKRAEHVASIIQEAGISAERIIVKAKGDTEQPFEINEDNRVSICIAANKGAEYEHSQK